MELDLGERDDYVFWLEDATECLSEATSRQLRVAVACRELGVTWEAIGRAMKVTPQAAQQRISPLMPKTPRVAGEQPLWDSEK